MIFPVRQQSLQYIRQFMGFAFLSGLGWLCDFSTYTLLVKLFDISPAVANFISSYVGVTFVWFTSLKSVFRATGRAGSRFLLLYWAFQFLSILVYSHCLNLMVRVFGDPAISSLLGGEAAVAAKIFVTPFNLVTNFIFMKFLTHFMNKIKAP